jgi:hypothetical protein
MTKRFFLLILEDALERGGKMIAGGLCDEVQYSYPSTIKEKKLFGLVNPTDEDEEELDREGLASLFWGSGLGGSATGILTPLRETLLCLCAAVNEEFDEKPLSRSERIVEMLRDINVGEYGMTCQQICERIIEEEQLSGNVRRYLSGSISSKLRKLVREGVLSYHPERTGARGGHVYRLRRTYLPF